MHRPSRAVLVATAAAALAVSTGCTHTDLPTNAPGHVDVSVPPRDLSVRAVERPRDPGERMVLVGYGGFAAAGFQAGNGTRAAGSYAIGPEVSLGYGWSERSHAEDDPILGNGVLPGAALAMNLGWTSLSSMGKGIGPLYAEAEYRANGSIGLAAGWTWDPVDRTTGPQATLNVGPLYARATDELGLGAQITFGVVLKGEHAFVWSR